MRGGMKSWSGKVRRSVFFGVIAAAVLVGAFFVVRAVVVYTPFGRSGHKTWVAIRPGASSQEIGQLLAQHGVIGNPLAFRVYLFLTRQGMDLQAGRYQFATGMTMAQVVNELRQGAVQFNTVVVTIPEGFTVTQIAQVLAQKHVCSVQTFMHTVKTAHFSYWFTPPVSHGKTIRDRLEGYLFPDTYDFTIGEAPYQVVNTMLGEMNSVLTHGRIAAMKRDGLSLRQLLTVASMIEREAKLARERPLIASVIYNRLHHKPPMKLRIDATVEYAVGFRSTLTAQDFVFNSPYNTYLYDGLPPGPIANPGLASIDAALHPAHTGYYYYVAKGNGTGASYFAATYPQQLANEALRQQNLRKRSRQGS